MEDKLDKEDLPLVAPKAQSATDCILLLLGIAVVVVAVILLVKAN